MAEIFLARAATAAGVARFVVLKRVLQERASDLNFLRMFLDEARLAAQLQHPNIAQVYDVGRLGDSYFFTMEYVHGVTLRELLPGLEGHPIPVRARTLVAAPRAAPPVLPPDCTTRTSASVSTAITSASCTVTSRHRT